ncbi:MAG: hypothetical protein ACXVP7_04395 [Actinomycetota bacterium]
MRTDGERHVCGLFPDATWRSLLREAGFEAVRFVDVHVGEPVGSRAFLARRPS